MEILSLILNHHRTKPKVSLQIADLLVKLFVDNKVWKELSKNAILKFVEARQSQTEVQDFISKAIKFLIAVIMDHNEKASKREKLLRAK